MTLIERAKEFAHAAHDAVKQTRKYTGEPYWVHTDAVAELVAANGGTEEMVAAAHLHDWLEDVYPTLIKQGRVAEAENMWVVFAQFPTEVKLMVIELTHLFTTEAFPELNRSERKTREIARLAKASDNSKTIKIADLIDNTKSIVEHDAGFAKTYLKEKAELLKVLAVGGAIGLLAKGFQSLEKAKETLDKTGTV